MKIYKADNELADKLFKQGLIEVTSENNKTKGDIRSFKTSRASHKVIWFDYGIKITRSNTVFWSKQEISEEDIKAILFYFKAKAEWYRQFYSFDFFNFDEFQERLLAIRKELEGSNANLHILKRKLKQQIIAFYDNIII